METTELLGCPFCGCTAILNAEDVPLHDEPELCCGDCNATNTRDFWNRRPKAAPALEDAGLLQNLRLKFTSGNFVPVERAWITRKEWDAIERILQPNDKVSGGGTPSA